MQIPELGSSEALSRAVRVSQAVNRVRLLPTVFVANPLLAAFIALTFWDHANRQYLIALIAVMIVLWTPAILSWRRLRGRPRPADVSKANETRAMVFSAVAGVLWATAAWYLFPLGGLEERATLAMLLAGLTGGSVSFFSSSPRASIVYFLPFMAALFVQALRYDTAARPVLPAAIGVFICTALLFTRTSWDQFLEGVRVLVERDKALEEARASEIQLELALSRMQDLAMIDELTGLKNRRAFFDDAEPAIAMARRRGQPVAVALLDLDHFKAVNDSHGHAAGDVVLQEVARRIVDTFREEQMVGRIGGEEFVALLPDTTPAQALVAVERVRRAVGDSPIPVPSGASVRVTLSGGIALLRDGDSVAAAIDHADKAMYRAKGLGRDRVEVFGVVETA